MSLVSIIIVNYNGKAFIKDCIESIMAAERFKVEILVVDNASTDGSCDFIKNEYPFVNLIELDKNYGFAEANNKGAEVANSEYLIFLNNDTVVTRGWIRAMIDVMSTDPTIGVAGSKLLLYTMPERINSAGANIVFNGGGYDIGFMDRDSEMYKVFGIRGAVCAASMMVRRKEFLNLGGFDTLYFMYFEDVDLCWRYWISKFKVVYVPNSIVYHRFGGTTGSDMHTPLRVFCGTRNSLFNIVKNYELHNIPVPIFFNFFYHFGKLLLFLFTLRVGPALAILKAYGSFFKNILRIIEKRRKVQRKRKIKDNYMFKNSLIINFSETKKEFFRLRKASKRPMY